MALGTLVKTLQNIMRKDAGINGDAQRIEQMTWMFFLKVYDAKEEEWEFHDDDYESIIPEELRWRSWAVDNKDGKALTGPALLNFVNNELFPGLSSLQLADDAPLAHVIVKLAFTDANNYMKDGVLLRQVINEVDDSVDFTEYKERHAFGEIYETILKDLQSAGNAGEFYTPRAVTDFMAQMLDPKLGESVADFACGTGGFLTSALKLLDAQVKTPADRELYSQSIYGMEKKQLPYLLCVTNMLLHDIDQPRVLHGNSLEKDIRDYKHQKDGQFDVVLMNPPYGGSENEAIKNNFPVALRSSETADLFLALIMYRLSPQGRAAVVISDGLLFGKDGAKAEIKRRLLFDFNLHTIVRLPKDVFAPYTDIPTNILFFNNGEKTEKVWFYRLDMPEGYKHFSKTKPILASHFDDLRKWWVKRVELGEQDAPKAKAFDVDELVELGLDFNQCPFPREEDEVLAPMELMDDYLRSKNELDSQIQQSMEAIRLACMAGSDQDSLNQTTIDAGFKIYSQLAEGRARLEESMPSRIRKSILQEAIQGKLLSLGEQGNDAEDLLDCIREQRASMLARKEIASPKGGESRIYRDGNSYYEESSSGVKCVDDEIPFDIPNHWAWARLETVTTYIQRGKSPKYSEERIYPVVAQKCNQWSGFSLEKAKFIDPTTVEKYDAVRVLQDGDLLWNSTGLGTLGRMAIYDSALNDFGWAVADSHVTVIRTRSDWLNFKFAYYYFASPAVQSVIEDKSSGSTKQKELSQETVRKYLIPIPPLDEQRMIVKKVDAILRLL